MAWISDRSDAPTFLQWILRHSKEKDFEMIALNWLSNSDSFSHIKWPSIWFGVYDRSTFKNIRRVALDFLFDGAEHTKSNISNIRADGWIGVWSRLWNDVEVRDELVDLAELYFNNTEDKQRFIYNVIFKIFNDGGNYKNRIRSLLVSWIEDDQHGYRSLPMIAHVLLVEEHDPNFLNVVSDWLRNDRVPDSAWISVWQAARAAHANPILIEAAIDWLMRRDFYSEYWPGILGQLLRNGAVWAPHPVADIASRWLTLPISLHHTDRKLIQAFAEVAALTTSKLGASPVWRDDVLWGLVELGGSAQLGDLYSAVTRVRRRRGANVPRNFESIVRRELELNSSDSKAHNGRNDWFQSMHGIGSGHWAVRR
jgi:hypothetical protein